MNGYALLFAAVEELVVGFVSSCHPVAEGVTYYYLDFVFGDVDILLLFRRHSRSREGSRLRQGSP